jgi:hypothetical protein
MAGLCPLCIISCFIHIPYILTIFRMHTWLRTSYSLYHPRSFTLAPQEGYQLLLIGHTFRYIANDTFGSVLQSGI